MSATPDAPRPTGLELPEHEIEPRPAGTSLDLPERETESAPPAVPESVDAHAVGPEGSGPLGNLVAAHFQRVEVAMLSRILATTLAGALPPSMVQIKRDRTLLQRLGRQPGAVIGVRVNAGDKVLTFRAPAVGDTQATVSHAVRGVTLSTTRVTVAEWLSQLGEMLNDVSEDDEATRAALQRALLS